MTTPTIMYGASDDLIEIDGAVRDEFNVHDTSVVVATLDDNTEIHIRFTYGLDGIWRVERLAGREVAVDIRPAVAIDGDPYTLQVDGFAFDYVPAYSEVAVIHATVTGTMVRA
jgi:hypothetical protein